MTPAKKKAYAAAMKRFAKAYDAMVSAMDAMETIERQSDSAKLSSSWYRFRSDVTGPANDIMQGYIKHANSFKKI